MAEDKPRGRSVNAHDVTNSTIITGDNTQI